MPSKALDRTATSRCVDDALGFMNTFQQSQSAPSVAVAHPGRSLKVHHANSTL